MSFQLSTQWFILWMRHLCESICRALEGTSCLHALVRCLHLWLMQALCQLPTLPTAMATLRLHVPLPSPIRKTYFLNISPSSNALKCSIKVRLWFEAASFVLGWLIRCICGYLDHFKHHRQKQKLPVNALCPVLKRFLGSKTVQMYQHDSIFY